jgi:hypothetical protein
VVGVSPRHLDNLHDHPGKFHGHHGKFHDHEDLPHHHHGRDCHLDQRSLGGNMQWS